MLAAATSANPRQTAPRAPVAIRRWAMLATLVALLGLLMAGQADAGTYVINNS